MDKNQIDNFEKTQGQLEALHNEILALSKKSPNDAINKFKLKFINQVLVEADSILTKKYQPFSDFKKFEEDDLPTNSDVTLILHQYLNCFEKLRADNINKDSYEDIWYWIMNNKSSNIRTGPPKKIK